jgi:hypothetical protein
VRRRHPSSQGPGTRIPRAALSQSLCHCAFAGEEVEPTMSAGTPSGGGGGGGSGCGGSGGGGGGGTRYANRRRTDLMPTIPSPRDRDASTPTSGRSSSAKSFTRSPGRTYSMSRLDQLARPRRRTIPLTLAEHHNQQQQQQQQQEQQSLAASSMSRSMSHLATAQVARGGPLQGPLKRTDNSRSMGTLPGAGASTSVPRPTRAERLRRKAREHQSQAQLQQPTGKRGRHCASTRLETLTPFQLGGSAESSLRVSAWPINTIRLYLNFYPLHPLRTLPAPSSPPPPSLSHSQTISYSFRGTTPR